MVRSVFRCTGWGVCTQKQPKSGWCGVRKGLLSEMKFTEIWGQIGKFSQEKRGPGHWSGHEKVNWGSFQKFHCGWNREFEAESERWDKQYGQGRPKGAVKGFKRGQIYAWGVEGQDCPRFQEPLSSCLVTNEQEGLGPHPTLRKFCCPWSKSGFPQGHRW